MTLNDAGLTANLQPGLLGVHVALAFQSEIQLWKGQMRLMNATNGEAALKMPPWRLHFWKEAAAESLTKLVPTCGAANLKSSESVTELSALGQGSKSCKGGYMW